ncbi:MAG: lysophospholipase [Clostridia bacterium]|nr:lysophospholipase [Clostridia bacterium]
MLALIITLSVVAFLLCLIFALAIISDKIAFGRRYDKIPLLKYFTAEDFNLTAKPVSTGKYLKGFVYKNVQAEQNGKVVVFCHGMGPGHIAYTTEIAYFCNLGYTVVAFDSKGCNFSGGKNIKGMYEGVKTATAAIDFAQAKFKGAPIYLIGHSWGAYSALCASAVRKVNAVVAISAPSTPSKTIQEGAVNVGLPKPVAAVLRPFWWLVNLFKYGAKGNANAAKRAEKNGTPTLLIHGDCDKVVGKSKAVFFKADGENIEKLLCKVKYHNPYNTQSAEKLLAELSANLSKASKMTDKDREYFNGFDYCAATEEDKEVMTKISEFLKSN